MGCSTFVRNMPKKVDGAVVHDGTCVSVESFNIRLRHVRTRQHLQFSAVDPFRTVVPFWLKKALLDVCTKPQENHCLIPKLSARHTLPHVRTAVTGNIIVCTLIPTLNVHYIIGRSSTNFVPGPTQELSQHRMTRYQ